MLAFRPPPEPAVPPAPTLSPGEHSAFEELARELNARLKAAAGKTAPPDAADDFGGEATNPPPPVEAPKPVPTTEPPDGRPILDRLPIGILVYRLSNLIYANRAFLDWTGYANLQYAHGSRRARQPVHRDPARRPRAKTAVAKIGQDADHHHAQRQSEAGRRPSVQRAVEPGSALVLMINTQGVSDERIKTTEMSLRRTTDENNELRAILDTATDGVLVLDRAGRVLSANRSAQALFGYDAADFTELSFGELFAPESRRFALDYLDRLATGSGDRLLNAGREAIGRVRQGGLMPLFITMGRIEDGDKFCAVLRDITQLEAHRGRTDQRHAGRPSAPLPPNPNSSPRSATRSARRSTPSSASRK